jgi:hypothetical protein
MKLQEAWDNLIGELVVLDTPTPVVYFGRLAAVNEHFITLEDADMVDTADSRVTKGVLAIEARRNGVTPNREVIEVKQSSVLSLSRLEDVRLF